MNLYGFAAGDPVNFSDPFGLCPPGNMCCLASGVFDMAIAKAKEVGQALVDLTPLGDAQKSAAAFSAGRVGAGVGYGVMAALGSVPGGEEALIGSKAVVRAGLGKLGLAEDVAKGVRGLLSSGKGEEWGVQAAEGGGAMVSRFVKGGWQELSDLHLHSRSKRQGHGHATTRIR